MKTALACLLLIVLVAPEIQGGPSDSMNATADQTMSKATGDSIAFERLAQHLDSLEGVVREYVDSYPYWRSLLINLIAAIIIFYTGVYLEEIKTFVRRPGVRGFWGKHAFGDKFLVVYGALQDPRTKTPTNPPENRFTKTFPGGLSRPLIGPWQDILSSCEVRAASHIIGAISKYRRNPIPVVSDLSALENLERSFVAFGSPFSNALSGLIEEEEANRFVEFGKTGAFIRDKVSGKLFTITGFPLARDFGIILRLKNNRFKGHYFFVCAGLGEWGTSGAAWYLANHWEKLREQGDEFAAIVEVRVGADSSARVVSFVDEKKKVDGNEQHKETTVPHPTLMNFPTESVPQTPRTMSVDSTNVHDSYVLSSGQNNLQSKSMGTTAYSENIVFKPGPKTAPQKKPSKRKRQ